MDARTSSEIVRRRLLNLRLLGRPLERPEDVVGRLGAVQSQDFGPAKWAVGRRAERATDAELDRAYAEGRILRTHVLRPTWHFVLPRDIRWLLEATASRIRARDAYRYRQLGLDAADLERGERLLAAALRGGNQLTRSEAAEVLVRGGVAVDGQRLAYLLMFAELDAVICSGAPRGKQHTYALLEERAPGARVLDREAALAELARRYFTSHGPATAKDFATWASLTLTEARGALASAGVELLEERIGGILFWSRRASSPVAELPSPVVHLLQGYDEYIMGYSESKHVLAPPGSERPAATPPVFNLVVMLDGRLAGFWKRTLNRDSVVLRVALDRPFDAAEMRALEAEAARYGEFLGLAAAIELVPGREG